MHEQVIVGEAVSGRAAQVRLRLRGMASNIDTSEFDMIELLCEAKEESYATKWGFSSLREYGIKELGLKARRVQYFTRVGTVCKAVGLTRKQYEPCGRSKLREIVRLDPDSTYFNKDTRENEDMAEHIVRLILDHDNFTFEQVRDEVARLLGQVGANRRVVRSYGTSASVWENVIQAAYEKARRYLGSKGRDEDGNAREYSDGDCQEVICAAFNASMDYEPEPPQAEKKVEGKIELPMEKI